MFTCRPRPGGSQAGWYSGTVKGKPLEDVLYVRPIGKLPAGYINKDVFIRKQNITGYSNLLPLKDGDKLEFLLSTRPQKKDTTPDGIKPSAHAATVQSYRAPRTWKKLKDYFNSVKGRILDSGTKTEAINSIMKCHALWFYIFNVKSNDVDDYQEFLCLALDFVFLLSNDMQNFPSRRKEIFGLIVEKNFIDNISNSWTKENKGLKFAEIAISHDPGLLKTIMPLLSNLVNRSNSDLSKGLYSMLLKVGSISDLSKWHDLTQIPTIEELFGDPLEKVKYLMPVTLKEGYKSTDDYLNVYYRLLRTECFSAIQKGISDLKRGGLDDRDMSVYKKVFVRNIDMEHTSILISLQFTPRKPVSDWRRSRKLMFGNLLCITIKGDFSDPIWLTVADRDVDILQKHSVIGVELISFQDSDADAAVTIRNLMLHSGKMTMVESPTYFKSFQHVLSSLKTSEIHEFSLMKEIVHGIYRESSIISISSFISPHLKTVGYDKLEQSQKNAFLHAMKSTLGIIQGPPGTGKTLVGKTLAHMFLCLRDSCSLNSLLSGTTNPSTYSLDADEEVGDVSENNPPILILTYKNHALDEFLKHCLEFCDKEFITRIGSQSKEDMLKDCLLHHKMKTSEIRRKPTGPIIDQIQDLYSKLSLLLSELDNSKVFTLSTFIRCITLEQLFNFSYNAIQMHYNFLFKSKKFNLDLIKVYYFQWKGRCDFRAKVIQLISLPTLDLNNGNRDEILEKHIVICIKNAFENQWLPNKPNLIALTQLQQKGAVFFNAKEFENEENEDAVTELVHDSLGADQDDLDEDYINQQLTTRISAYDEDRVSNIRSRDKNSQKMKKLNQILARASNAKNVNTNSFFCLSDFPTTCASNQVIFKATDLWDLSEIDKYTYIYTFLHSNCDELMDRINSFIEEINLLQKEKEQIDQYNKLMVLKNQKIVGATIVGASVQLSLLNKLAPKVVIVEEAAEVLEASLVAVLTKSVDKLILIGDHKQLKPQVDTYHLRKEHNFHISMMERLILMDFAFERLLRQGRMRPEFSAMLKDIYPDYEDFPNLKEKRRKIKCLPHCMFFWSHKHKETQDRSVKNIGEANMVVALALFFIASGVDEENITIICAYLGQVQVVRKLFRKMRPVSSKEEGHIDIKTIDEYQGDENEYVIISLTRSNKNGNIGFLKEHERRCVAQSRAKCGLYFVGNDSLFRGSNTWKMIIETMENKKLINEKLPITCYRHPDKFYHVVQEDEVNKKIVTDSTQLMYFIHNKNNWCTVKCNSLFPCNIESHRCKKPCTPRHDDRKCHTKVPYTFIICGHSTEKFCYIEEEKLECEKELLCSFPLCGHKKQVRCHDWLHNKNKIVCTEICEKNYDCPLNHSCNKICGRFHGHFAADCPEQIEFIIPKCGHKSHFKKTCGEPIPDDIKCKNYENYIAQCGHKQRRLCSDKEVCQHTCSKLRPDCGHPCTNLCSKPCLEIDCSICAEEYKQSLLKHRKLAEEQLKICKSEKAAPGYFKLLPMSSEMIDLNDVKEKCDVFLSLFSTSRLSCISGVWKVECPENVSSFWEFATKANGIVTEELYKSSLGFIDTSSIAMKEDLFHHLFQDQKQRFEFVKYGNRQSIVGNECTLIITDVLLGDSIDHESLNKARNGKEPFIDCLKRKEKDSIVTKSIHHNQPAIYSVYDRRQILLKYIVHFTTEEKSNTNKEVQGILDTLPNGETIFNLAEINLRDVSDPLVELVQKAISLYNGHCSQRDSYTQSRYPLKEIKSVGIAVNHKVDLAYQQKVRKHKGKSTEVYAYHATSPQNISSIIKTNLDPGRKPVHGNAYGPGCYFSEHPEFSMKYGQETMFIFKLLLVKGKYTKVQPDKKGFCQQLVLQDASMFKPQFVLRF